MKLSKRQIHNGLISSYFRGGIIVGDVRKQFKLCQKYTCEHLEGKNMLTCHYSEEIIFSCEYPAGRMITNVLYDLLIYYHFNEEPKREIRVHDDALFDNFLSELNLFIAKCV